MSNQTADINDHPAWIFKTERQFQDHVVEMAVSLGWDAELIYHTHDSRRSTPGFPDLVMARPPEIIYAELKLKPISQKAGRPTEAQMKWLNALQHCNQRVYVWRPGDLSDIEEVLK